MTKRFKKDNSSVCLDLGNLLCIDHEVEKQISRIIQEVEREVEKGISTCL